MKRESYRLGRLREATSTSNQFLPTNALWTLLKKERLKTKYGCRPRASEAGSLYYIVQPSFCIVAGEDRYTASRCKRRWRARACDCTSIGCNFQTTERISTNFFCLIAGKELKTPHWRSPSLRARSAWSLVRNKGNMGSNFYTNNTD